MTNGWLIYSEIDAMDNKAYIDWFIEEANKQGINLQLILREQLLVGIKDNIPVILYHGEQTRLPSFAVVRTIEPLLNRLLEELGVQTFNSSTISEICNHKAKTYFEMAKLGIPMVNSIFIKKENIRQTAPMSFPFVIKEVSGRGGKQVFFVQDQVQWEDICPKLANSEYVIQETNVQLGKDLRVFVVGNEIIGAILRESKTDFRANFKLGGSASWYPLKAEEKEHIQKIINHFEFGMVGIDFLIGHNGELLFNEIEDVVGSRTLSAVSDINIVEKYVAFINSTFAE